MTQIDRQLRAVWDRLRGSRPHRVDFLEEINIRHMRGIKNLRVPFDYPVTVLAGENACGKSTVLFGCAAAYKSPTLPTKRNTPSALFPGFSEDGTDNIENVELEYAYITQGRTNGYEMAAWQSMEQEFFGAKRRDSARTRNLSTHTGKPY